jgi:ParB family chromosome partitioning protein
MSQPRRTIQREPLAELAASIKEKGVIQPILVRPIAPVGDVRYELVAGERRWQASQLAGLTVIPAVVKELSDAEAVALALIENIQREDLSPADEARALKRLAEEFGLTHEAVAQEVGRSRAAVTNLIRLLDLPEAILDRVDSRVLSMGHARALLGIGAEAGQLKIAELVVLHELSVRETERLVRESLDGQGARAPRKTSEPRVVSEVLHAGGVRVQLEKRTSGGGRLIVEFAEDGMGEALVSALRVVAESNDP